MSLCLQADNAEGKPIAAYSLGRAGCGKRSAIAPHGL